MSTIQTSTDHARNELSRYYGGATLAEQVSKWLEFFANKNEDIREWHYLEESSLDNSNTVVRRLLWRKRSFTL